MTWLVPAIIATLSGSVVLSFIYSYLSLREKEGFLRYWTAAWIVYAVRLIFELINALGYASPIWEIGGLITALLNSLLLLWGTYGLLNRKIPDWWIYGTIFSAIWIIFFTFLNLDFFDSALPIYVFSAACHIWAGSMFLRAESLKGVGQKMTGWMLILWGIHKADYPFLRPIPWFAPWGYLIAATLAMLIAIGTLLVYFQKARRSLQESEARFRRLYNRTPAMLYSIDEKGRLISVSDYWLEVLGYERYEVIGRKSTDFMTEDSRRNATEQILPEFWLEGGCKDVPCQYVKKNGDMIDVLLSATSEYDSGGRFIRSLSVLIDITEHKRAENALRLSEDKFAKAFRTTPDSVNINRFDDGLYLEINEGFTSLTGYTVEEVRGKTSYDLNIWANPEDRSHLVSELQAHGEVQSFEALFRMKDGSTRVGLMSARIIEVNGEQCILSITRDITERKKSEEALRKSENRFRSVFENSPVGILTADQDGVVTSVNGAYLDIMDRLDGYEEIVGTLNLLDDETFQQAGIQAYFTRLYQGEPFSVESTIRSPRGKTAIVRYLGTPLFDDQQCVSGCVLLAEDITDRKRVEIAEREQRLLAEALRETAAELNSTLEPDEVLDRIIIHIDRVVPNDAVTIMLVDDFGQIQSLRHRGRIERGLNEEELKKIGAHFNDNPVFRRMIETRHAIAIADVSAHADWKIDDEHSRWIKSHLGAPIIFHQRLLGFISLDSAYPGTYSDHHAERLQAFAHQASTAIQNARHAAALAKRNQQLMAIYEIGRNLASTLDTREVYRVMYDEISRKLLNAPHFAIALFDETTQALSCDFVVIDGEEANPKYFPPIPPVQSPMTETIQSQQPRIVGGTELRTAAEIEGCFGELVDDRQPRSALYAPLIAQGGVIGVLTVQHHRPDSFHEIDLNLITTVATQAAIAIKNAQLFSQTQRHAAELEQRVAERTAELELQRQQLQAILDATGEGIFYIENNAVQYANQVFLDMTGYDAHELIGHPAELLRVQTDHSDQSNNILSIISAVGTSRIWRDEMKLYRKDGSVYDAGLTISVVKAPGSKTDRSVTVVRDISKEKLLEAQKARFIANASHELRSPITTLNTRLYLMRRQPEKMTQHMRQLEQVVLRIQRLVEDLLDLSRFENGVIMLNPTDIILQDLVASVIEMEQPEAELSGIFLRYLPPPQPIVIFGDPERIIQVIINLVANAIHHTPKNGYIEIMTNSEVDQVTHQESAVISILDTGSGISSDDLPHIFQPFYQVSRGTRGAGLGLSIAREIIELHGGYITVESEIGRGSRFSIVLPLGKRHPAVN